MLRGVSGSYRILSASGKPPVTQEREKKIKVGYNLS